jgi:hypothetical protein
VFVGNEDGVEFFGACAGFDQACLKITQANTAVNE